jgi:ribose transport system permease protein
MKKLLGITIFLLLLYGALLAKVPTESLAENNLNLAKRIGLFGIISLGVAFVIITGGIDLSIGSVVALSGTLTAMLLMESPEWWPWFLAIPTVLVMGAFLGLIHGLLVTRLKLSPFVVTLCGLFIYRGIARTISANKAKGLGELVRYNEHHEVVADFSGLRHFLYGDDVFGVPRFLVIFLIITAAAAVFLHFSVYGRYLYAIGNNERAARYSGIATNRYKVLAYVLCSTLAAFFGILFLMEHNSVRASADGNFFELYAIAGAVLGGCNLRGGEGTVIGVFIGTAILWILPNLTNMYSVRPEVEFIVIGGALLLVAILDELLRPRRLTQGSS